MLPNRRVVVAQLRAQEDAMELVLAPPDKVERNLHVAIGDPQAPLATVLTVLEINGLLGDDGRLRPEVGLVSVGDHFDWGKPEERQRATDEGTQLLAWLAAHPPNQVQLVFGNHDLVRVGELSQFTDESFREAQSQADKVGTSAKAREAFLKAWPMVPGPEVVTRDFSCFDVKQRELVTRLLKKRRARLAVAIAPDLLVVHAGITTADLEVIDAVGRDALGIAVALNRYLDDRVAEWNGKTPLDLSPLHEQGSAKNGEAKGILFHRPANPASARVLDRDSRRFDPRTLPRKLTQVIGHSTDKKCRTLLGDWADSQTPTFGPVRGLRVGDTKCEYRLGVEEGDALVFLDGAMNQLDDLTKYELFDLELRQPLMLR
jgi:hypothetical protein